MLKILFIGKDFIASQATFLVQVVGGGGVLGFNKLRNFLSLELSNNRRRLCWEATPRSIHEGVAQAISQSDCLSFDTNHAQLFAENGNLGINVTIQHVNQM